MLCASVVRANSHLQRLDCMATGEGEGGTDVEHCKATPLVFLSSSDRLSERSIARWALGRCHHISGLCEMMYCSSCQIENASMCTMQSLKNAAETVFLFLLAIICSFGFRATAQATEPVPNLPHEPARVFFSGHSLLDNPLPEYVASIARSLNTPLSWNGQNIPGATIQFRTRGRDRAAATFDGYKTGKNRSGSDMDIVSELRFPQTVQGPYDVLVLTERHDIIGTLMWEDTVPYARHFHERLIAGNPQGTTYFYHSWLGLRDKGDPSDWVAYERGIAPAWQCVASRINQSLRTEGRSDRVIYLPAGLALAGLVEWATNGGGVNGVTGGSFGETVDRIFDDDVHLTPLGVYYMSLVTYSSVYRRSPVGAWAPSDITAQQAQSLQAAAWNAVSDHFDNFSPPDIEQCRSLMRNSACPAYSQFVAKDPTESSRCVEFFSRAGRENPLHFDASTDASSWLPAP